MFRKNKPVLDERELMELYRIEHMGLWLMYGLLFVVIVVQLLAGASAAQLGGELTVMVLISVVMIAANVRQGIWEVHARPSLRDNLRSSLMTAAVMAVLSTVIAQDIRVGLAVSALLFVLCFALLSVLMTYMRRRQRARDEAFDEK